MLDGSAWLRSRARPEANHRNTKSSRFLKQKLKLMNFSNNLDDFNFLCWKLGERIAEKDLKSVQEDHQLRGLSSIGTFLKFKEFFLLKNMNFDLFRYSKD